MYDFKKINGRPHMLGAVHLPAFLDGEKQSLPEMENWLLRNAEAHIEGGFDSVMIQDNTPPLSGAETKSIVYLSALCYAVVKRFPEFPIGLVVESNDAKNALTIAASTGVRYIRSKVFVGAMQKPAGIVEGNARQAYHAKPLLDSPVSICADIYDRMGQSLFEKDYLLAVAQAKKYKADAIILTGDSFTQTCGLLSEVGKKYPSMPILAGGGVDESNVEKIADLCDGMVISSCLLKDGKDDEWDVKKIKKLVSKIVY